MRLNWGCYFDDFPMLEPRGTAVSAYHAAHFLLKVLGWKVALEPTKCFDFQSCFVGLGVEFDLARSSSRIVEVKNKASRVLALQEAVTRIFGKNCFTPDEAAELRGQLLYAAGQLFGRSAGAALFVVGVESQTGLGLLRCHLGSARGAAVADQAHCAWQA